MLQINKARRATLATFKKAIADGVSQEFAARVALARYRAFFPTAAEAEAMDILTRALAAEDRRVRRAEARRESAPATVSA
jgi:plasmid stability protein